MSPTTSVLIDETVETILDARHGLTEVLADSLPFEELDALLRELTAEILEVYRTVVDELGPDASAEGAGLGR